MLRDLWNFDAPTSFATMGAEKRSYTDWELNPQNSNDKWFLVPHEQLSPIKELLQRPIKRQPSPPHESHPSLGHDSLTRKGSELSKSSSTVNKSSSTSSLAGHQITIRQFKTSSRINPNQPSSLNNIKKPPFQHAQIIRNKSWNSRTTPDPVKQVPKVTNLRRDTSKSRHGISPCPFPPRIERQWQKQTGLSWYSLNSSQIEVAQKFMHNLIVQPNSKIHEVQLKNDNSKKSLRKK